MKRLIIYIIALFIGLQTTTMNSFAQNQDNQNWSKINSLGLYDKDNPMFLSDDLWGNKELPIIVNSLNHLPNSLNHAPYRELVKRLLLSEADINNKSNSPQFLTKRINLLYNYGLFDEAEELYKKIPSSYDLSRSADTALLSVQKTITDGGLAPACLDIQVFKNNFEKDKRWSELSKFCQLRFASEKQFSVSEVQFQMYPALKNMLMGRMDNVNTLQPLEFFVAQSESTLFDESFFENNAKNIEILSDLVVYSLTNESYLSQPYYQCFLLDAAKRGLRSSDFVQKAYENKHFDRDVLEDNTGEIKLHPCDVPAYFYQRLARLNNEEIKSKTLEAFLAISNSYSAYALKPFGKYIDNIDGVVTPTARWNAGIILGLNDQVGEKKHLQELMPLYFLLDKKMIPENDYKAWLNIKSHENIFNNLQVDLAAPIYISSIISGKNNKLTNNDKKLEQNLPFSLTYENKSLDLGYGFSGFMSKMYREKDMFEVIITVLNLMGSKNIEDFSINEVAVILSTLKAYKLEKESVMLALEYLQ